MGKDGTSFSAVRPLLSTAKEPANDRRISDLLWPVGSIKDCRNETDWRFLTAYGHDFDNSDSASRHRWSVFPLIFGGQNSDGKKYFAVFPLGGALHEFIGRDKIFFILFPLYAKSSVGEVVTHSVLWPIFSRTEGPDVSRFRVFPLYGKSVNRGRWTKRFIMWPFWTSVRYEYPEDPGGGFILFPLFGRVDTTDRKSRMLLPPLFKWEKATDHKALNCPWPFIQYASGTVDKLYLWPFWGKKKIGGVHRSFLFWPIVWNTVIERKEHILRRFRILPFLHYESRKTPSNASTIKTRHFKLWPILSYRREGVESKFRMPALWPLKHTPAIERNWAPIWGLFTHDRDGADSETEFFWGLFRRSRKAGVKSTSLFPFFSLAGSEKGDGIRRWSIFGGLLGYERAGLRKQVRLLYFLRFGAPPSSAAEPTTQGNREP